MPSVSLVIPNCSEHKLRSKFQHVEGSGQSIKDPMIMWLITPCKDKRRCQRIADTMREVAYITKHRYIWIRSLDHRTQNTRECGFRAWKPAHPHITIYTSNDPSYYHLEGHAYVDYDKWGNINGLSTWNELTHLHRGLNPELAIFGQRMINEHELPGRPEAPRLPGCCGSPTHHLAARVQRLTLDTIEPPLYCC
ncbi:hypothetical protein CC79DRAFT_1397891 [Sarocladium strictum]